LEILLEDLEKSSEATAPEGGEAMVDFILEVEELEERIAPGGYTGAGS
jgi:hypothetical protein